MFHWLWHQFRSSSAREQMTKLVDALNAQSSGGQPVVGERRLGELDVPSGVLALADPQYLPGVEVPGIIADRIQISGKTWDYPDGGKMIASLRIQLGDEDGVDSIRQVGSIAIDSARLVVVDRTAWENHWTQTGKDRIGFITTAAQDFEPLHLLTRRFKLKTVQENRIVARIVGPVEPQLERDILEYLETIPRFAEMPFLHFRVRTNNSFNRVNDMPTAWGLLPVGNEPSPLMFACGTGHGDGTYDVQVGFAGEIPRVVSIDFIE